MITKIVSGGQTGADLAALDAAIELNIPHGGWIPKGRKTETGPLPDKYHLQEMPTGSYTKRTEQNVIDSDGTAIFSHGSLSGSSLKTYNYAKKHNKPCLHLNMTKLSVDEAVREILRRIKENKIQVLNVAGPRGSKDPEIYAVVKEVMTKALTENLAESGLEYLLAIKEGRIPPPPVWNLIGCRLAEICEGSVTLEVTPAEYHYNRFGVVQGGILCTVLDASMACTLGASLPQGTGFSSPEIKVNYFRPVTVETGVIRCESTIIHRGNRIAVLEGKILDKEDKLYAQSMASFMIFMSRKKADSGTNT